MRVLVITNLYPTPTKPSVGTFVAQQVESLRARGVEIDLLHLDRQQHGRRAYSGLSDKVRRSIEASEPDLVHLMYGGVAADVVTREIRERPVLVSFCGTDLLGGGGRSPLGRLSCLYGVRASRRAATRATGIVVKSQNLEKALPSGVDRSKVWIVPNGVDLSRFAPRDRRESQVALGWDPRRKHLLFPSSANRREKRFKLARAAVDLLSRQRHDVELHQLANVPPEEVSLRLNAADLVLLTSRHEGSPNAIKEALACNVPIVSVDVGDVRERIEGIDGCYLTDPVASSIAMNLERALVRGGRIDGRTRISKLSLERVAAKLRDVYEMLAPAKSRD